MATGPQRSGPPGGPVFQVPARGNFLTGLPWEGHEIARKCCRPTKNTASVRFGRVLEIFYNRVDQRDNCVDSYQCTDDRRNLLHLGSSYHSFLARGLVGLCLALGVADRLIRAYTGAFLPETVFLLTDLRPAVLPGVGSVLHQTGVGLVRSEVIIEPISKVHGLADVPNDKVAVLQTSNVVDPGDLRDVDFNMLWRVREPATVIRRSHSYKIPLPKASI